MENFQSQRARAEKTMILGFLKLLFYGYGLRGNTASAEYILLSKWLTCSIKFTTKARELLAKLRFWEIFLQNMKNGYILIRRIIHVKT